MTCIVGMITKDRIYIAGDSAGSAGYDIAIRKDVKVFIKGEMIFGFTSSFRMGQLLQYSLKIPRHPKGMSTHKYLCTLLVNSLRKCLKSGGFAQKDSEKESAGTFLVGYRGELFSIESDYQVGQRHENFDSVGCGDMLALSSMYSTNKIMLPVLRLKKALECAAHFNAGVRSPFLIKSIEIKSKTERSKRNKK